MTRSPGSHGPVGGGGSPGAGHQAKPPHKKPPVRDAAAHGHAAPVIDPGPPAAGFAPSVLESRPRHGRPGRRNAPALWIAGLLGVVCLGIALAAVVLSNEAPPLVLQAVGLQQVALHETLELTVAAAGWDASQGTLAYSLAGGPDGATIEPQTGLFRWSPGDDLTPGTYEVVVRASAEGRRGQTAEQRFLIDVVRPPEPPRIEPVADQTARVGELLVLRIEARDPHPRPQRVRYRLAAGDDFGARLDARTGEFRWTPGAADLNGSRRFVVAVDVPLRPGPSSEAEFTVHVGPPLRSAPVEPVELVGSEMPLPEEGLPPEFRSPPGEEEMPPVESEFPVVGPAEPIEPAPQTPEAGPTWADRVLTLHQERKLFTRSAYPALRTIFADRFADEQSDAIRQAFAGDETIVAWLDARPDVKEELYTAIDPAHDDVVRALQIFRELKTQFPQAIEPFAELAIAVSVTWDRDRAIYDYLHHQRRTKSQLPEEARLGAIENFQYIITADHVTQAYGQFLPWEFLRLTVDHRTPLSERQWAVAGYGARRQMFGQCYKEVPYDNMMLETSSDKARLNDRLYTLPNLRQFGGVCAMQADYAARVGKSLGIPAAYVRGEAVSGEHHAWVMWVELKAVPTRTSLAFSLESFGRYRGDLYYVGQLEDPQTGRTITDRQLELRLHNVGTNVVGKRHADLIMASFPMLVERTEMSVNDRLVFLNRVMETSPGNEEAWRALASMSREGTITKEHHRTMQTTLNKLFTIFRNFPDFTWTVFDDLVAYLDVPKQRAQLYRNLVDLYVGGQRPDLACEAVLTYTQQLVADNQLMEAATILQNTILAFPAEGRYVPRMLDGLDRICAAADRGPQDMAAFYQRFLPLVPQRRGDRPAPYCIAMYQRGIASFRAAGQEALAQRYEAELQRLRGGQAG
jgi:hypothetical protein